MKPNFKILDGLRGIAATYVLLNHSRGNLLMGGSEYAKIKPMVQWSISDKIYYSSLQLTSLGREFVILFFILSGFSIAYSLKNITPLGGFYLRRFIRLYPPFILALIWAGFVFMFSQRFAPILTEGNCSVFDSFRITVLNLLYYFHGSFIGQFWSLTYEVIFYLLVPLFVIYRQAYYICSISIYFISIAISWQQISGNNILMMYILDYNIYFAVGIWLFNNYHKIAKKVLIKCPSLFFTSIIILFLLMIVIKLKTTEFNKITPFVSVIMSILLIVYFLNNDIYNKILGFLGNISYTLYITHIASIYFFKTLLFKFKLTESIYVSTWYFWIVGAIFSLGISYIFYHIAEAPSKNLLKKLRAKTV